MRWRRSRPVPDQSSHVLVDLGMPTLNDSTWSSLVVAQYETVRAEVIHAVEQAQRMFQISLTSVAALTALSFSDAASPNLTAIVVYLLVPAISLATTILWASEIERAFRGSYFLGVFEQHVGTLLDMPKLLVFNAWKRSDYAGDLNLPTENVRTGAGYVVTELFLVGLPIPIGIAGIDVLPEVDLPLLETLDNELFHVGDRVIWWMLVPALLYLASCVVIGARVLKRRIIRWSGPLRQ